MQKKSHTRCLPYGEKLQYSATFLSVIRGSSQKRWLMEKKKKKKKERSHRKNVIDLQGKIVVYNRLMIKSSRQTHPSLRKCWLSQPVIYIFVCIFKHPLFSSQLSKKVFPALHWARPRFHSIRKILENSIRWKIRTWKVTTDSVERTLTESTEKMEKVSVVNPTSATFHTENFFFPTKDTVWFAGSLPKDEGLCKTAITWEKIIHLHPKTHQHVGQLMHFLPVGKSWSVLQCLYKFLHTAIRRCCSLEPPKARSRHVENWWYVRPTLGV